MKNIHAYTQQTGEGYPGYVSLNEHDGEVVLTVRSPDHQGEKVASCKLPVEELLKLADCIYAQFAQPAVVISDVMA